MYSFRRHWFGVVVGAYCLYAIAFIFRTSFEIDGTRYFSLFDDAMVSMRFAKHLTEGQGLVWNVSGSRVEGFTNPLWVGMMAVVHMFGFPESKISLVVQLLSLCFLVGTLFFVRRIAKLVSNDSPIVAPIAVIFTAFYLPLNNWSLQGMEVGLLTFVIVAAVFGTLVTLEGKKKPSWLIYLLALSVWIRIDAAIPMLILISALAWFDRLRWRKHIMWGIVVVFGSLAVQTILRYGYYGEWLPNTYYLKMTGFPFLYRIARGFHVSLIFLRQLNPLLVLIPIIYVWRRPEPACVISLLIVLGQLLYSTYVGGDAWEWWGGSNRYVAVAMPMFFIVYAKSCLWLFRVVRKEVEKHFSGLLRFSTAAAVVFLMMSFLWFNAISGLKSLRKLVLIEQPLHADENAQVVQEALILRRITDDSTRIAVVWAGALPYFLERPTIDMLGKNDAVIAREQMKMTDNSSSYKSFYPGHMKYDYSYSIGRLKPDIVTGLWMSQDEALQAMGDHYIPVHIGWHKMYFQKSSSHVRWNVVDSLQNSNVHKDVI